MTFELSSRRWLVSLAGALAVLSVSGSSVRGLQQRPPAPLPAAVAPQRASLDRYCVGCHNDRVKTGGLALDTLDVERVGENAEAWEKVVRKLRGRMMPPAGRPRPDEATYESLVSYLETSLDRVGRGPSQSRPHRHLPPAESNRIPERDPRPARRSTSTSPRCCRKTMRATASTTSASAGSRRRCWSATWRRRRRSAAWRSAARAPSPASHVVVLPADLTQEDHVDGLPFGTRGGALVHAHVPARRRLRDPGPAVAGPQRKRRRAHRAAPARDHARRQAPAAVHGHAEPEPESAPTTRTKAVDKDLKVRVPVPAGPHEIGVTFLRKTSALLETERQPYQAHFNMDRHPRIQPAVYSVSIAGPFDAAGAADTPSRQRLFVCRPVRAARRRKPRAPGRSSRRWRAAPTGGRSPMRTSRRRWRSIRTARADGGFEAGIEMALRAHSREHRVPVPHRARSARASRRTPPIASATWSWPRGCRSSCGAAFRTRNCSAWPIGGKLQRAGGAGTAGAADAGRPAREALVTNFAGQWLYLRNLAAASPDARLFPDFDDNLRQAFRRETELFFESIVQEDRSVLDLLRANYTFLNERLAKHYGIPNVYGSHFRRVTLGEDSVRGGLLGQGSILTVTSYANRTSPVLRGKWILENILGTPPPPPPPNVPPLPDNSAGGKVLSMRERMAQHRANAACAGCHQLMDPAGLSMENFDAIGRWRTRTRGGHGDRCVGQACRTASTFDGVAGLRHALLQRPELFVVDGHRKAADLRAGPRRRLLRCAGGPRDCAAMHARTTTGSRRWFSAS